MAGRLMRGVSAVFAVFCAGVASAAVAQTLRDPTRPPVAATNIMAGKTRASGWILQSVLISPERRYAIINGEVVALGASIAGAELISIAAERVTLRTREGLRVVYLFPDVSRLGMADASSDKSKHMSEPEGEKDSKVQRSASPGMKK